jgi:pyruvate, water dikinase
MKLIIWFNQLSMKDVPVAGGKNASLGEMYSTLTKKGVKVPNGFAVTADAYRYFIEQAGLRDKIKQILSDLNTSNISNIQVRGKKIRDLISKAEFPKDLAAAILKSYRKLGKNVDVAVRSSATAEDLPDASFAGQQETYLNVREKNLLEKCRLCFASLFTDRAISYRTDKGFDHFSVALSIGVQRMVRSDKASSGVMFSLDTESGFKDVVFITGAFGLGENVVQGAVNPDEFYVHKPTKAIISKKLGEKRIKMIYTSSGIKNVNVDTKERNKFIINDDEILKLAKWACIIEDHYSAEAGHHKPMDMEWAKDGLTGELFIVQARPETVQSRKDVTAYEDYKLTKPGKVLIEGRSVGSKIGSGAVNVIKSAKDINKFKKGQILVTDMTDPDWEPIMKIASAIVTNRGGRTCHAAIISRELGIPCVVGTMNGSEKLKNGMKVTASCAEGDIGKIYSGLLKYEIIRHDLKKLPSTKTHMMINLANPEQAFNLSFLPVDGVGLAREEFIINQFVKVHPNALINFKKLKDKKLVRRIEELTVGYKDKKQYYIDKLSYGIATIAAAFYPRPVVLRFSDFKSNEYANLLGGKGYEPVESNPMIGFRGASRYYSKEFRAAFGLECKAVKKVLDMGLHNLKVMIPFCRSIQEGKNVLAVMKENGLKRKDTDVYVMCEVPANVIMAEEFLDLFDGFSIGSNDLTQLTLGVDRDSELLSDVYDEENEAVKKMIERAIHVATLKRKYIGFCGQAVSDKPKMAEFLIKNHIQSVSLNPDVFVKAKIFIAKIEKNL